MRYDWGMRVLRYLTAIVTAACVTSFSAAGEEPIVTSDLLRIRTVSSIDVAPDGTKAVFAVRSIAVEPAAADQDAEAQPTYAYRSHLFLLDLFNPDAEPRQLTFGDRRDGSPSLSPDGRWIAFVRGDEDQDDGPQCWIIPVDGGEARPVTNLEHGAGFPRWSPDGALILVSSEIPIDEIDGTPPYPMERPKRQWKDAEPNDDVTPKPDGTRQEIRAWLAANAKELNPDAISRLNFQGERRLRGLAGFDHLFVVDPDDPQMQATQITNGFFDHHSAAFMPDGQGIIYASNKAADQHPDRLRATQLWRMNVDGSDDRLFLSVDGWSLSAPKPSRDGSLLAFSGQRTDEPTYRQRQLGLVAVTDDSSAEPTWMTDESTFDASVGAFRWRPNGDLLFTAAQRGSFPLMMISFGLLEPVPLVDQINDIPIGVQTFDAGGGSIVYAVTSPVNPCRLMVRDGSGDRLAYDLNPWVAEKRLSMPQEGWISRPDGTRVQYWLMEPTNRDETKTYPLVLEIHGGPAAMWGPGESTMWHEFQLLCSWGYGVVYANPRGSGGYGYEFQRGNFQNWGEGPAGDVLAVVDEALRLHEWIDQKRLVVTGGSYAGYLTAWIVGNDHRFKAAVAQRGVYDLETFFGEGNAWRLVQWTMGGYPFDDRVRRIIERNSPITYVDRIRTPLLIMHASNDLRTGVSQSEMLYRSLKALNRPVEYIRYPNAGHDLSRTGDPTQRMDRLNRIIEFFERHVDNPRRAPQIQSEQHAGGE